MAISPSKWVNIHIHPIYDCNTTFPCAIHLSLQGSVCTGSSSNELVQRNLTLKRKRTAANGQIGHKNKAFTTTIKVVLLVSLKLSINFSLIVTSMHVNDIVSLNIHGKNCWLGILNNHNYTSISAISQLNTSGKYIFLQEQRLPYLALWLRLIFQIASHLC